jgi:hypothetical protein
MPATGERAEIRLLDCACGEARTIRTTAAWNWQQGCMLQWLPGRSEETLIFNDRRGREWGSVVCARDGTIMREYRAPIYCINSDGTRALSLSFARLNSAAPGYGYPGGDETASDPCPANDGIWGLDLRSGATNLLISISDLCRSHFHPTFTAAYHYFNHAGWSPGGSRFLFLHRWQPQRGGEYTTMYTANADGSGVCALADDGMVSHYTWKSETQVLAWAKNHARGTHYFQYTDRSSEVQIIGEQCLTEDGHPTFDGSGRYILTDTYPNWRQQRTLILYDTQNSRRRELGAFDSPPFLDGPLRCDLHPRFDRQYRRVCVDSAHEGVRRLYTVDLLGIISNA